MNRRQRIPTARRRIDIESPSGDGSADVTLHDLQCFRGAATCLHATPKFPDAKLDSHGGPRLDMLKVRCYFRKRFWSAPSPAFLPRRPLIRNLRTTFRKEKTTYGYAAAR